MKKLAYLQSHMCSQKRCICSAFKNLTQQMTRYMYNDWSIRFPDEFKYAEDIGCKTLTEFLRWPVGTKCLSCVVPHQTYPGYARPWVFRYTSQGGTTRIIMNSCQLMKMIFSVNFLWFCDRSVLYHILSSLTISTMVTDSNRGDWWQIWSPSE